MIKLIDFEPRHAVLLDVQDKQLEIVGKPTLEYGNYLLRSGPAFTGVLGDELLFCIGKTPLWEGRCIVWFLLSKNARNYMLGITKIVKRLIEMQPERRIEIMVRPDFKEAKRWMRILNIPFHHHEEKFLPGGLDVDIHVRFN